MKDKMKFSDFFLQTKKRIILNKCLHDEELMSTLNIKKLVVKRIINFIITQYNQFKFLNKKNSDAEISIILEFLIQNRISLFSRSIKYDLSLQQEGIRKIIDGADYITQKNYLNWKSLTIFDRFKIIIFCIHIAEFIWDSSKVFPPDLEHYRISEYPEFIFFRVFEYVFNVLEDDIADWKEV